MQFEPRNLRHPGRRRAADARADEFAAIVNTADIGIVSKNLDGIVTSWNPAAENIFGFTASEMIGAPIKHVFPDDLTWEEDVILSKVRRGEYVRHFESERLTKAGTRITVSLIISPIIDANGRIIGASKIARDISSEIQLRRSIERAKDQLLSNVSHELRTPLTAIKAALKLLELRGMQTADERAPAMLRVANNNADRLLSLVNELLDYKRFEANSAVTLQACRIADVINPSLEAVSATAELRGVELICSADSTSRNTVFAADPVRLQQVLLNLLSNALKYSPRGSRIDVTATREANHLAIRVIDQGRGIPVEHLAKIFERFEQVDKGDARLDSGVGLGLAISRMIVEQHNGAIWAERNDARRPGSPGSTFCVLLPCEGPC